MKRIDVIKAHKYNDQVVIWKKTYGNDVGKAFIHNYDYKGFVGKIGALVRYIDKNDHYGFVAYNDMKLVRKNPVINSNTEMVNTISTNNGLRMPIRNTTHAIPITKENIWYTTAPIRHKTINTEMPFEVEKSYTKTINLELIKKIQDEGLKKQSELMNELYKKLTDY